ncbi:MAG: hypothetical protein V9F01_04785 [Chitinophagaceae bacterium]
MAKEALPMVAVEVDLGHNSGGGGGANGGTGGFGGYQLGVIVETPHSITEGLEVRRHYHSTTSANKVFLGRWRRRWAGR